ncbi:MAG: ATP-binding protein [Pyrinomonadaceae bacterium]
MLNSIRTRLTIWYLLVLALIVIAFATVIYILVERNLRTTTDENLSTAWQNTAGYLRKEEADLFEEREFILNQAKEETENDEIVETPGTIETAIAEEVGSLYSREYAFIVLDQNGNLLASTVGNPDLLNGLMNLPIGDVLVDLPAGDDVFRVQTGRLTLDGKSFQLLAVHSLREQTEFLGSLKRILVITIPIALFLAGLGGYFLARRSLAPVVSISEQASHIGSSNLNERLTVKNEKDELGKLARAFNELLSRLESSFERQRQFMADASHELRTPLSILQGESEIAISKGDRTADEYRESLTIVHDESKRLSRIVDDLLILARGDSGQMQPVFSAVYLDEIVAESVRALSGIAEKRNVSLRFSPVSEMSFEGDETLLHRLFLNLLDNAIKYNKSGGTVSVTAKIADGKYQITISDEGAGIADKDRQKIFERFYRADKTRSRDNTNGTNGVGLGLSIAAWIAEVHNGLLTLEKSDSAGSVFLVTLPL